MCKILSYIFSAAAVAFLFWVAVSFAEVIAGNLSPDPTLSALNFFGMLV